MLCHCLSTVLFMSCSTEEIRKSIETLDRILDQYDSGNATKELTSEKKLIPQKADRAAHMLASCMQAAASHKLRKRPGNCPCFVGRHCHLINVLPCDAMLSQLHKMSVCLSVTCQYYVEMSRHILKTFLTIG